MSLRSLLLWAVLLLSLTQAASAQPQFQTFFLSVGSSDYVPAPPGLQGFGRLSGANSSARAVADLLSRSGATGITLVSAAGRYVGRADFDRALSDLLSRARSTGATNPLIVVYFAGHGISEGVAWNHFSVPGNLALRGPMGRLDAAEMARHTIHAASLADALDKVGMPYLLLLDTCYEGQPASFGSPVLTPGAIESLRQTATILRHMNEFRGPNPVVFSAEPGREVPLAPDPRSPDQASLGPIGRRLLLLSSRAAPAGTGLRLSDVVAQLTSRTLDSATSPPVTHATAPRMDGVLLGPSAVRATVESRTGTATAADVCCGGPGTQPAQPPAAAGSSTSGDRRMRGSLSIQGGPGEFVSGGMRITLPPGTPVTVSAPDPRSLELSFATRDKWELSLAAPEGAVLAPGTYRGAVRYPFQAGSEPGLSLTGAGRGCNEVAGEFTVTRLRRDQGGRVVDLAVSFVQRCDDNRALLSGSVTVGD